MIAASRDGAADLRRLTEDAPSPLPHAVLYACVSLVALSVIWACIGKLDTVTVSQGKLVPQTFLKIVQPAEAGIVREILVKEGETVREGQVLLRMDSRIADADVRTLEGELARKRLQLRRIDAELAGAPLRRAPGDPPDVLMHVEAQLQARRRAYLDALGAEQAVRNRAEHDLGSAMEIEAKLMRTAPIYREQEKAWDQLAREGYAGRLLALDRQRSRIEVEQELKAQSRTVAGLKAAIAQAQKRIAQIESNYHQQLHDERADAQAQYDRLQQEWRKQEHRHALLELKAPQSGIVKDLATHTAGTVLSAGTIVLTLVPLNEPLMAEVWISSVDAGFVQPQQRTTLKFATYPFQKYGTFEGRVLQVSADAQDKVAMSDGTAKPLGELVYRALIELDIQSLQRAGRQLRLSPGMSVTAEVHIGERTVIEYLLSPIQKITAEAARER